MANFYSSGYQKAYIDVPSQKINPGEQSGDSKVMYAEITGTAEFTTNDTIYLGKLPKGARVLGGRIICPATGATGIFNIGYQANGVDSADLDAYVVGADPGAAAVSAIITGAGLGKKLGAESTIVLTPTENSTSFTGDLLQFWLDYVVI